MTANRDGTALSLVYAGSDFKLYYRYAADGKITEASEGAWGGDQRIRHEPFTQYLWDGALQVYSVNGTTSNLMAKSVSEKNLGDASSGWYNLGGGIAGSPVSVYYDEGNKRVEIFIVGKDGQIWGCYWNGSKWNWEKIPVADGKAPLAFEPERINVSTNGKRRIDLVGVSLSNDIYHRFFNGSKWSNWTSIGINAVGSRPHVWTTGEDRVDIVVKDATDSKLYHTACDKGVWLGWQAIGDTAVVFDPSGTYCLDETTRFHVAATASNTGSVIFTTLNFKAGELGKWDAYTDLGGVCSASPKLTHRKGGIFDLFVRGMDSSMYYRNYTGGKWGGFNKLQATSQTKPC